MKRSIYLLLLILTACAPLTSFPTPTATPAPALTSTPVPTSTPANTPTPDAMHEVFDALQAEDINVEHRVDNPDLGWGLLVNGVDVPGAYFDEDGKNLHILVGDNEINVPADQAAGRLFVSEDGVLGLKGEDGGTVAAFGPQLTTEALAGKWFTESEVIGTPDSPIFIGDDIQDHYDFLHAEKVFLKPFPADTYYPDPSKIVRDYYRLKAGDPSTDFTGETPFGKLAPEDLDKSPFKTPVNCKILKGPLGYLVVTSEQIYDPSNPKKIQRLSFVGAGNYKTLAEAQKAAKDFSHWQKNGYILLPNHFNMVKDVFDKFPWGKNILYFLKQQGYSDSDGNIDNGRIWGLVDKWLNNGQISPELEEVLLLTTTRYIR
jgi:hypothetical protein